MNKKQWISLLREKKIVSELNENARQVEEKTKRGNF